MRKNAAPFLLASLLALAFSGCASFDRTATEKRLASAYLGKEQTADTSLTKPFRMGILLDLETSGSDGQYRRERAWDDAEREMVVSYADSLVKEGAVSGYFFMSGQDIPMNDLNSAMGKASEKGADALLTIRGVLNVDKYINPIGILDPTIIGALVLPGSNMDVRLFARLDLWDLKNRKPLISLKSESMQNDFGTTLFIRTNSANTENAVNDVKTETLRPLLIDFKKKFAGLKFQPTPPPYPKNEKLPGLSEGK